MPKSFKISAMEKAEIKHTSDYLKDFEEGFLEARTGVRNYMDEESETEAIEEWLRNLIPNFNSLYALKLTLAHSSLTIIHIDSE